MSTHVAPACRAVARVVEVLTVVLLALLVMTVWVQVVGRLVLNSTPLWTVDFATLFMMWAAFLGSALTMRHGEHFTIEIAVGHNAAWDVFTTVASRVIVLVLCGYLLIEGIAYVRSNIGWVSGMTELPMPLYVASVPVGGALMLLFAAEQWFVKASGAVVREGEGGTP